MNIHLPITTLEEFLVKNKQGRDPHLHSLIITISQAAKPIHRELSKGGLMTMQGKNGQLNHHEEEVTKLDEFANNEFVRLLKGNTACAAIASEEMNDILLLDQPAAGYIVYMDPLDGSSNIEVNSSTGTIFSIYRRKDKLTQPVAIPDFLQKGKEQVCAGYILYGPSTQLVFTMGRSVVIFALNPLTNGFCLTHTSIKCPRTGPVYSLNYVRANEFPEKFKNYWLHSRNKTGNCQPTARYNGSLVADIHRILIKGGLFVYPATDQHPKGKLRLMYECNPVAFILETAGGKACNAVTSLLNVQPASIHEQTVFIAGSAAMVNQVIDLLKK